KAEKILVVDTKCRAAEYFGLSNVVNNYKVNNISVDTTERIRKWDDGKFHLDLIYTTEDAHMTGLDKYVESWKSKKNRIAYNEVPNFPLYIGFNSGLYGRDDDFDQPVCHAASQQFDLVIFMREVGRFQIVTEVLDVRNRETCWESLIYTS